jgi:hypothetical protein
LAVLARQYFQDVDSRADKEPASNYLTGQSTKYWLQMMDQLFQFSQKILKG